MFSSFSAARFSARRVTLVGVLIAAVVALLVLGGAPLRASADDVTWTSVSDEASLQAALTAQDSNIVLSQDITDVNAIFTDSWAATINLAGYSLTGQNLSVALGLKVIDEDADGNPLSTGVLTMKAATTGIAGISVNADVPDNPTAHGSFDAEGVTIVASSLEGGAGIGGDAGHTSGPITINNSSVWATGGQHGAGIGGGKNGDAGYANSQRIPAIDISNSSIIATGGVGAAAIGGGYNGNVASPIFDISPGLPLTVSAASTSVVGPGVGGAYTGTATYKLTADLNLNAPDSLDVPVVDTDVADVPQFGTYGEAAPTLSGTGSLTGDGTLYNYGSITLAPANISSGLTIDVNNYNVDFDGGPNSVPEHQYVHVYAPTLEAGGITTLPAGSALNGYIFRYWGDGGGTTYDDTTSLQAAGAHFIASYTGLWSFDTGSNGQLTGSFAAGSTVSVPLVGEDIDGNKGDQSPFATVVSSDSSDTISGDTITFGTAGPRTLQTSIPGRTIDPVVSNVTVVEGPISRLTLTPSASTATAGNTVTFVTDGFDAGDDALGDQSGSATLTSNVASDVIDNSAHSVTFKVAGTHIITSTVGAITKTTSIVVTSASPKTMTITPTKSTATAGIAKVFTVTGVNSLGASLGDISNQVVWSGLASSDSRVGNSITFGATGTRTIKATLGKVSVSTTVTVVHGALARLAFVKPVTTAVAGTTKTFSLLGYDSKNNSLGSETAHVTLGLSNFDSGNSEAITATAVKFATAGVRTVTATDGGVSVATNVKVTPAVLASIALNSPPTTVNAGSSVTFTATSRDAYGNLISGNVTTALVIHSTDATDKIAKNKVSYTHDGNRLLTFKDGVASTSATLYVAALAAVPGKLTFDNTYLTAYPNRAWTVSAFTSDKYGNQVAPLDASSGVTYATPGAGGTHADQNGWTNVTFTTLGKHVVTASAPGYTTISETFNVIKDTSRVTFPTTPIVASIPSTITLSNPLGTSQFSPSGTVTLHYGTKSVTEPLIAALGNTSTASVPLPALKVGSYTFYATYSGDGQYNAYTSPKYTVKVVLGALDHLSFVKPPTKVTAGGTVTYSVLGYDANNNLIGTETSHATFSLDTLGLGETISGAKVKFHQAGVRVVTATVGSVTKTSSLTVVHTSAATLDVAIPFPATAGYPVTFTATAEDVYGNPLGSVSSLLTGSSTVSSDHFVKNTVTMTKAGTRTITFKDGAAHESFAFTVDPGDVVIGKLAFESSATHAYPRAAFSVQVDYADKYGNPVAQVTPDGVYTATGSGNVVENDAATIAFATVGNHTVTATYGGVHVSKVVSVAKDTVPFLTWPTTGILSGVPTTMNIEVAAGASGLQPTGTVTVHYGTHSVTGTLGDGEASVDVPALATGSYVFYVTYSGDATYNSKTTAKVTVRATSTD